MTSPSPIYYAGLQGLPGWAPVTGSNIGPIPPTKFSFTQSQQGLVNTLRISSLGIAGKYADEMLKGPSLVLPVGASQIKLSTTFAFDSNSLVNAQAKELGVKWTDADGWTYNAQIQANDSTSKTNMQIDVVNKEYGWSSNGVILPKFTPNTLHSIVTTSQFDSRLHTVSTSLIRIDGIPYTTPADLLDLPAQQLGWEKGFLFGGIQTDTNPLGGPWDWDFYQFDIVVS
jgi:hypothetical protein